MASYDYKGTKITGTSTTAKKFEKSGVKNAKRNDTYLNVGTGHVYECTKAGKPDKAEWKYTHTAIMSIPTEAVTGLGAPKRVSVGSNNRYMQVDWKVPKALTNEKKGDRAQHLFYQWTLHLKKGKKKATAQYAGTSGLSKIQSKVNLNGTFGGRTRDSFHPVTDKSYLTAVSFEVSPTNSMGRGLTAMETRQFEKPVAPKIGAFSFNAETGHVSVHVTTNAGTGYKERYDTYIKATVKDSRTGREEVISGATGSTRSTDFTVDYDVQNYGSLDPAKDWIRITVSARARGYAGDSATVSKSFYVSYPVKATISERDTKVTSKGSDGKVIVGVDIKKSTEHPVDRVKLEYLANTTYATASEIPADEEFRASDIIDDAQCKSMAIGVQDLIPERGRHSWIRLKTWHASEARLFRYSNYVRLKALETPVASASDDRICIVSAHAGADGESAVVQLGWNDGSLASTGTELSWADAEDAWKSTKEPDSFEFSWEDLNGSSPIPVTHEGVTYPHSATITIKGLNDATLYYIRARRYNEGDEVTYSAYSNSATVLTSEIPETIVATCDRYVPTGKDLPVYWTFSGNGVQTDWRIVSSTGVDILKGEGSVGSALIEASRLADLAVNGDITFTVEASTGGDYVVSEPHTVTIMDNPTLSLTVPATLTVQPLRFTAESDMLCDLIVIVTSEGASGQFPQGLLRQTAGDTMYSGIIEPEWTDGEATIELPGGLSFWDLGRYNISVTAVDRTTGLQSEPQEASFAVAWANPAVDPFEAVTVTPVDEVTEAGVHLQAADIILTPPAGCNETDVYDIYRMTGDGPKLIGEGFPLTYTARDLYAPFGDAMTHYYRVALRTVDGDTEYADIEYAQDGSALRFDWAEGSLELPYNLSIADTYKKDTDIRAHMDGSTDGYWNKSIERTASLNTDVIRLDQQEDIAKARQLARYTGPVFVRTPDGSAYEADVQVSDMSTTGVLTAIAIDATEVGLTDEFKLPTPNELEEEEAEP